MELLKFGGTSVGSCERMLNVLKIITSNKERKVVVLSAMAGTTNKLKEIVKQIEYNDLETAKNSCQQLRETYYGVIQSLYQQSTSIGNAQKVVDESFDFINSLIETSYNSKTESLISVQGELISTKLFHLLCQERDVPSVYLPALDFMKLNDQACPDNEYISATLNDLMSQHEDISLFITQGYICRNHLGEVDNLGRGGSDYTATILGAILKADEIQIWTDIDGVHNNDPRYVEPTVAVSELSFDEASLLAYFGAKILHPASVIPAKEATVPIRVKNTLDPKASGTLIHKNCEHKENCLISLKDEECLIQVNSNNKLSCNNFLLKVLGVCQEHQIELDMVSATHQSISLVTNDKFVTDQVLYDLTPLGTLNVAKGYSVINLVGNFQNKAKNLLNEIFRALETISIIMINQELKMGDCSHMQLLINSSDKRMVLNILNKEVLHNQELKHVEEIIS